MTKVQYFSARINVCSNNNNSFTSYLFFIRNQLDKCSTEYNIIRLPKTKKKFTLFRSPHVHKKSKEHFLIYSYKATILLKCDLNIFNNLQFGFLNKDTFVTITKC
jgi:ribosomal protein S10